MEKESSYKESFYNFMTEWLNKKYGKIEENLKLYFGFKTFNFRCGLWCWSEYIMLLQKCI